jgi:Recombination directionality factor-like
VAGGDAARTRGLGASGKRYWSEYSADGHTRYCKRYQPVPMDASGAKAIRVFGGRKSGLREERQGLCDPEDCAEYQSRQCNLSGRFIFFIPGIASITAFELATHSFYSMNAAIQRFQTIAFMRGGRISGFLDSKRTPFTMSKQLVEVPHIDELGRPVRVKQWLIDLQAPIDVTALLRGDDEETLEEAGAAVRVLEGPRGDDDNAVASAQPVSTSAEGVVAPVDAGRLDAQTATALARGGVPAGGDAPDAQAVLDAAQRAGIPAERFEAYAAQRWGSGWKHNTKGRLRALQEIQRCGPALLTPSETRQA